VNGKEQQKGATKRKRAYMKQTQTRKRAIATHPLSSVNSLVESKEEKAKIKVRSN